MEVDLDLSQDRLRDFLQSKLQEIVLRNQDLKETQGEYNEKLAQKPTQDLGIKIENLWNTVCNNKLVVCYQLSNFEHFDNLKVALNCHHLNYQVKTFNKAESTLVTVTLETAQIIEVVSFKFHGFVIVEVDGKYIKTFELPQVTVDLATLPHTVNDLATISTSLESNLVLVLPEGCTTPINLEKKCKFTYSKSGHYLYNDILVVNTSTSNTEILLTVYTKSEEELLVLVHHLLSSVPGSLVLPQVFYQMQNQSLEKFARALSLEVNVGLQYCQMVLHPGGDLQKLGVSNVSQLECDSDLAYFKLQKL